MLRKTGTGLTLVTLTLLTVTSLIRPSTCEAGAIEKMATFKNDVGTYADSLKTGVKNTAVSTVGYFSAPAAQKLDSINITQTVYNAPNSISSGLSNTAKAAVVSGAGLFGQGYADTLKSTNISQSLRQAVYNAPTSMYNYYKGANAKFTDLTTSFKSSVNGGFKTLDNYLNSKYQGFKNLVGLNTPSKPVVGMYLHSTKSEKITSTVSDTGTGNAKESDNTPWYDKPGKNPQEHNENLWFSGMSHGVPKGVVRIDTVKETNSDVNNITAAGGGPLNVISSIYLPTNNTSFDSPAHVTKTSDGNEIGNWTWGQYLK